MARPYIKHSHTTYERKRVVNRFVYGFEDRKRRFFESVDTSCDVWSHTEYLLIQWRQFRRMPIVNGYTFPMMTVSHLYQETTHAFSKINF